MPGELGQDAVHTLAGLGVPSPEPWQWLRLQGLLLRSWCQADQPRVEKDNRGTTFPGVLGVYPPLRGARPWQMGWHGRRPQHGGCCSHECWMSVHRTAQALSIHAGTRLLPSLGLSLQHIPYPSQREAMEPAGETLSSQGFPQARPS